MKLRQIGVVLLVALAMMTVPAASVAATSTGTQTVAAGQADAAASPAAAVGPATGATAGHPGDVVHQQSDASCEYPIEVEDATGETVRIEEEPEEVVVLAPNMAQHMWELGAEEKVTGMPVNQYTAYLEGSEQRTNIAGEFGSPINEEVVDLEPDLVLTGNIVGNDAVQELRQSNLTVFKHDLATGLDDLTRLVERTGRLVGECEAAQNVTAEMRQGITLVENATANVEDRPRVFYDMGDEPSGPFTANSNAFEHDVITTAGTENIAADAEGNRGYLEVNPEFVIEHNPEYVITPQSLSSFPGYNETTALQNDQVIEVNANYISQHGPRAIDVLVALAEEFHPEAMADAREPLSDDGTDNGTNEGSSNSDEDDVIVDDDDGGSNGDDSGPGFSLGVAAAALVALTTALLARRQ